MKHPAFYTTQPFGSLRIMEVDPGTVITDERTGQEATIDDCTVVRKGNVLFCTKVIVDRLKSEAIPAEERT